MAKKKNLIKIADTSFKLSHICHCAFKFLLLLEKLLLEILTVRKIPVPERLFNRNTLKLQAIYKKGDSGTGVFLRIFRNTYITKRLRRLNCKHKLLLQESFIDRNNEVLLFKIEIHNKSTKLNDFIQFINYLVRRNTSNVVIRQSLLI